MNVPDLISRSDDVRDRMLRSSDDFVAACKALKAKHPDLAEPEFSNMLAAFHRLFTDAFEQRRITREICQEAMRALDLSKI